LLVSPIVDVVCDVS